MPKKTISFCQGKGNVNHNNRKFVTPNVDRERVSWDETFVQEKLEDAYRNAFGEALEEYNAKQKRADRKKTDYLEEIRHSKNGEHDFYEDIVQIGTMKDTAVIDENGNMNDEALKAIEVLREYAETFQERNPNLYLFNCVMHLDEKTPHLHLDYFPVAEGYKQGLSKRNSISKALQCMGIPRAEGKTKNEESVWKDREREYIKFLCEERGIEIEQLNENRDNYSLPEYREIMQKVDRLNIDALRIEEAEAEAKKRLKEYLDKEEIFNKAEVNAEKKLDQIRKEVTEVPTSIFHKEEYVKMPKKTWNELMKYSKKGMLVENINDMFDKQLEKIRTSFEKTVTELKDKVTQTEGMLKNVFGFIKDQGMYSQYEEYVRPKTLSEKLELNMRKIKENQKEFKKIRKDWER